jgi:hypothetical protein
MVVPFTIVMEEHRLSQDLRSMEIQEETAATISITNLLQVALLPAMKITHSKVLAVAGIMILRVLTHLVSVSRSHEIGQEQGGGMWYVRRYMVCEVCVCVCVRCEEWCVWIIAPPLFQVC